MTTATKLKLVAIVFLVSLSLAVIIQNTSPIEARILFVTIPIPLTVLIGGSLIAGFTLGLLTPVLWRRRQQGPSSSPRPPIGPPPRPEPPGGDPSPDP